MQNEHVTRLAKHQSATCEKLLSQSRKLAYSKLNLALLRQGKNTLRITALESVKS